jgi:hypothetical protein
MPEGDIPSMLQIIEAKIASSEIEVPQRDSLVRLRHILEEDLQAMQDTRPSADQENRSGLIPSKEQEAD